MEAVWRLYGEATDVIVTRADLFGQRAAPLGLPGEGEGEQPVSLLLKTVIKHPLRIVNFHRSASWNSQAWPKTWASLTTLIATPSRAATV
jgi:hypothetical protein